MTGRLLCAIGVLLSGGCSLVLDFDDPPAPPDALQPDAIPAGACDFGEDNQTRQQAFPLDEVAGELAGICDAGDHDFYSINVADGQAMVFEIRFMQTGARGDLDLRLYDVDGNQMEASASADDDERIACPSADPPCAPLAAGPYFLEVYGFGDQAVNGYSIELTLTP